MAGEEVRTMERGMEGSGSRAAGHGNRRSSSQVVGSLVIDGGPEIVESWGRVCGMMVEGSSSQAFGDSSGKGVGP